MSLFMLKAPTLVQTGQHASGNFTMLEDYVESSEEICNQLITHLEYTDALPSDQLPLEVPLMFHGKRMWVYQCSVMGSFECMKCINVLIPK